MTDVEKIVRGLSAMERELLLGQSKGWGSWMFSVGNDLCAKGLGRKHEGSIYLDTPLGLQVRAALEKEMGE